MHSPIAADALTPEEQKATCRKVTLRLIPLLFICYVIAYIDRINVGFAKLHLQEVLGVSPDKFNSAYGFGAGLFFIGYFLFEVPSNLILQKVGARIWIARIMIVWGIVSMAFMFLKGVTMFYVMRFLLGAAEAGFFPGVLLYLTYWYPPAERARTIALFALGGVAAGVVGSPISGKLLEMNGIGGLHGWQWLFFIEAIPAIVLGVVVFLFLPNSPKDCKWLSEKEKTFILSRLESSASPTAVNHDFREILKSGRVWLLCLLYFLMNIGSYGFEMWSPTIVKTLSGGKDGTVGFINALPYLAAALAMYFVSRSSDKSGERRWHVAVSAASAAVGFVLAAKAPNPYLGMVGLIIAFAGLKSTIAPFWALSTAFLSGTAAAGGIALINSVGNLGGYVGPHMMGYVMDKNQGNNMIALMILGGSLLAMGILTLTLPKVGGTLSKQ